MDRAFSPSSSSSVLDLGLGLSMAKQQFSNGSREEDQGRLDEEEAEEGDRDRYGSLAAASPCFFFSSLPWFLGVHEMVEWLGVMMTMSWRVEGGMDLPSRARRAPYSQRGKREGGWGGQAQQRHSRKAAVILLLIGVFAHNPPSFAETDLYFDDLYN